MENFVIAEFEKRRKLGLIQCDRFYYYKSAAGREIDLVFESGGELYAIEIKAINNPSNRDIRNLKEFRKQSKQQVNAFLFYPGEVYTTIDDVRIIPVASLRSGM